MQAGNPPEQDGPVEAFERIMFTGNVVSMRRPSSEPAAEPFFTNDERKALRQLLKQFAHLKSACPTMRRELDE